MNYHRTAPVEPDRPRVAALGVIVVVFVVSLLLFLAGGGLVYWAFQLADPHNTPEENVRVQDPPMLLGLATVVLGFLTAVAGMLLLGHRMLTLVAARPGRRV